MKEEEVMILFVIAFLFLLYLVIGPHLNYKGNTIRKLDEKYREEFPPSKEKTSPIDVIKVIIVLFIVMVIFNVISENSPFLKR